MADFTAVLVYVFAVLWCLVWASRHGYRYPSIKFHRRKWIRPVRGDGYAGYRYCAVRIFGSDIVFAWRIGNSR